MGLGWDLPACKPSMCCLDNLPLPEVHGIHVLCPSVHQYTSWLIHSFIYSHLASGARLPDFESQLYQPCDHAQVTDPPLCLTVLLCKVEMIMEFALQGCGGLNQSYK